MTVHYASLGSHDKRVKDNADFATKSSIHLNGLASLEAAACCSSTTLRTYSSLRRPSSKPPADAASDSSLTRTQPSHTSTPGHHTSAMSTTLQHTFGTSIHEYDVLLTSQDITLPILPPQGIIPISWKQEGAPSTSTSALHIPTTAISNASMFFTHEKKNSRTQNSRFLRWFRSPSKNYKNRAKSNGVLNDNESLELAKHEESGSNESSFTINHESPGDSGLPLSTEISRSFRQTSSVEFSTPQEREVTKTTQFLSSPNKNQPASTNNKGILNNRRSHSVFGTQNAQKPSVYFSHKKSGLFRPGKEQKFSINELKAASKAPRSTKLRIVTADDIRKFLARRNASFVGSNSISNVISPIPITKEVEKVPINNESNDEQFYSSYVPQNKFDYSSALTTIQQQNENIPSTDFNEGAFLPSVLARTTLAAHSQASEELQNNFVTSSSSKISRFAIINSTKQTSETKANLEEVPEESPYKTFPFISKKPMNSIQDFSSVQERQEHELTQFLTPEAHPEVIRSEYSDGVSGHPEELLSPFYLQATNGTAYLGQNLRTDLLMGQPVDPMAPMRAPQHDRVCVDPDALFGCGTCAQSVICVKTKAYTQPCSYPTESCYIDATLGGGACKPPVSPLCSCSGGETGLYPDPFDPRSFLNCNDPLVPLIQTCGFNQEFHPIEKECKPIPPTPKCTHEGTFANTIDCRWYYVCIPSLKANTGYRQVRFRCETQGTLYHETNGKCQTPDRFSDTHDCLNAIPPSTSTGGASSSVLTFPPLSLVLSLSLAPSDLTTTTTSTTTTTTTTTPAPTTTTTTARPFLELATTTSVTTPPVAYTCPFFAIFFIFWFPGIVKYICWVI
ncbi:Chitin binding domain [Trinorchestia longiramus]|nr:Chitin binding domain [Trinorchestia longiramus]